MEAIKLSFKRLIKKNQTSVLDTEVDYHQDAIYLSSQAFLLFLSPLNILVLAMTIFIILKSRQFHKNLITLLVNLCIEGILYIICRMILMINLFGCTKHCFGNNRFMFSKSLIAVDIIRLTAGIGYLIAMSFIFIERGSATIHLKTYEKRSHRLYLSSCILGQYCLGFVVTFSMYKDFINFFYFLGLAELGCFLFSFSFIIIDRMNQRRYKKSITVGNSYTLSQRYQLAENIRSSNFMKKFILVYTIFNSFICLMFASIWLFNKQSQKWWTYFAFELAISIYGFAIPTIVIYSCEPWKQLLFRILQRSYAFISCKRVRVGDLISSQAKLKTSSGAKMVFVAKQEGGIHFNQLHQLWS